LVVIASIRELNRASPFVPYEIQMASDQRFRLLHRDFIFGSPKGSFVVVVGTQERPYHLNSILIDRPTLLNGDRHRHKTS
jgi:hypothetical protein